MDPTTDDFIDVLSDLIPAHFTRVVDRMSRMGLKPADLHGAQSVQAIDLTRWAEQNKMLAELRAAIEKHAPQAFAPAGDAEETADDSPQPAPVRKTGKKSAPSSAAAPTDPAALQVEVFISYSHEDEKSLKKLLKHLALLKREEIITDWHDRDIGAGEDWKDRIDEHLNSARVILLLVSADFLASDYCYDIEATRALERHKAGEARVIPVILKPVDWHSAPFGKLKALPKDGKPVSNWSPQDKAFADIAQGIRKAVADLGLPRPPKPATPDDSPEAAFDRYRAHMRQSFRYHEEDTPPDA